MKHPWEDTRLIEAGELADLLNMTRASLVVDSSPARKDRFFPLKRRVVTRHKGVYFDRKEAEAWIAKGAKDHYGRKRTDTPHHRSRKARTCPPSPSSSSSS